MTNVILSFSFSVSYTAKIRQSAGSRNPYNWVF